MDKKKLRIISNKGFHITFDNGWTVSVQFGAGNYCDNYHDVFVLNQQKESKSNTAECWSWNKDQSKNYPKEPLGYQTSEQVFKFMKKVHSFHKKGDE